MKHELVVKPVQFLGDTLMAAQDADGNIWAGVRWMCEGIGLSEGQAKNERLRIQGDAVLSKGGRNLTLPTGGGNQDVLCLKLEFVPLWLAKISITPTMQAENPGAVDKLVQYQLKAKDVLAAAFLPGAQRVYYPSKSSSVGEAARLIVAVTGVMDKQRSPGWKQAAETELLLHHTGFPVIEDFVEKPPAQLTLETVVTTTMRLPERPANVLPDSYLSKLPQ